MKGEEEEEKKRRLNYTSQTFCAHKRKISDKTKMETKKNVFSFLKKGQISSS